MSRQNETPNGNYKTRNDVPFNFAKDTYRKDYRPKDHDERKKYKINCETSKQAFAMAKWCNGIPDSQQPDEHPTKISDRNNPGKYCTQYKFTKEDGIVILIRRDNPTEYENSVGNQGGHYNVGLEATNLDQHYYFDQEN